MINNGDGRFSNYYQTNISNSDWSVPNRYTKLAHIGDGAFGAVCSAFDEKTKTVRNFEIYTFLSYQHFDF